MKKWLKVLIWVVVILVVLWALVKVFKPAPVAAAEINGIVSVATEKTDSNDVTNVMDNLLRLDVSQKIGPKTDALIEADLVGGLVVVNEGWILFKLGDSLNIKAGQFLLPAGYASQVAYQNRKLIASPAAGSVYDSGLGALGKVGNIHYSVAAVNGDTTNSTYDLTGKLSVDLVPKIGLNAGVSYYEGKAGIDNCKFTAAGIGAVAQIANIDLAGEYIESKDVDEVKSTDSYVQGSALFKTVEPAVRMERLDPDKNVSGDASLLTTLGVNIYVLDAKLSLNYEIPNNPEGVDEKNRILAQLLVKF